MNRTMTKHIYLVGFMGSGKSTIGPVLAHEMKRPFYDLDVMIEKEHNKTITTIFKTEGEQFFRKLESHSLLQSQCLEPCVMALGGGAFISKSNQSFIAKHGISVWLKLPLQLAKERCENSQNPPLSKNLEQWEFLFQFREMQYRLADIHVEVAQKSPDQIVQKIQNKLRSIKK